MKGKNSVSQFYVAAAVKVIFIETYDGIMLSSSQFKARPIIMTHLNKGQCSACWTGIGRQFHNLFLLSLNKKNYNNNIGWNKD